MRIKYVHIVCLRDTSYSSNTVTQRLAQLPPQQPKAAEGTEPRSGLAVNCSNLLGFKLYFSIESGSTSGTCANTLSNFLRLPRPARASKYSSVESADNFSNVAEAMNWLIETPSFAAYSR